MKTEKLLKYVNNHTIFQYPEVLINLFKFAGTICPQKRGDYQKIITAKFNSNENFITANKELLVYCNFVNIKANDFFDVLNISNNIGNLSDNLENHIETILSLAVSEKYKYNYIYLFSKFLDETDISKEYIEKVLKIQKQKMIKESFINNLSFAIIIFAISNIFLYLIGNESIEIAFMNFYIFLTIGFFIKIFKFNYKSFPNKKAKYIVITTFLVVFSIISFFNSQSGINNGNITKIIPVSQNLNIVFINKIPYLTEDKFSFGKQNEFYYSKVPFLVKKV